MRSQQTSGQTIFVPLQLRIAYQSTKNIVSPLQSTLYETTQETDSANSGIPELDSRKASCQFGRDLLPMGSRMIDLTNTAVWLIYAFSVIRGAGSLQTGNRSEF